MKQTLRLRDEVCPITKPPIKVLYTIYITFTIVLVSCVCTRAQVSASSQEAGPAAEAVEKPIVTQHLNGVVVSAADGRELEGATVKLKNTSIATLTNGKGEFSLATNWREGVLEVSFLGYITKRFPFADTNQTLTIFLEADKGLLEEVMVSTGYQEIPKERATGSFVQIDNELLNSSFSTDILSRLNGVSNGLAFITGGINPDKANISIRGLSTISANSKPLIILDNFEYTGDIRNINPNDIESVTILKDAAASSIWGAKAGNGVIVITSKQGRYNGAAKVAVSSNLSISGKPNLLSRPQLSSSDYIDLETYLFDKGYYKFTLINRNKPAVSPVIETLVLGREGLISAAETTRIIDQLRPVDTRNDLKRYFYRKPVSQQHAITLTGGGENQRYYVSAGWDKKLDARIGDGYDRLTLNLNNTYQLLKERVELSTGIIFTQSKDIGNYVAPSYRYPYAQLADAQGTGLPIAKYRQAFIDTAGGGRLLDWQYRPLDELDLADNTTNNVDYKVNLGLKYRVAEGLGITVRYQYGKGNSETRNYYDLETFYTRDYINQFSIIDPGNGEVQRPVPLGGILDNSSRLYAAHKVRGQIDYHKEWEDHALTGIAGGELNDLNTRTGSQRLYGYNKELANSTAVDLVNTQTSYITGRKSQRIQGNQGIGEFADRYVSVYANLAYTYKNAYTATASIRKDASNLFGVNANQKWIPLWSAGLSWNITEAGLQYPLWLSFLKVRATYGYNGNVDKSVSAYLVSRSGVANTYNMPTLRIKNPPNPDLRWERTGMVNLGVDYALFGHRIAGSVDFYKKRGTDLMGDAEMAPSSGLKSFRGNTASMKGRGVDLVLNSTNIEGALRWSTSFSYSYAKDEITEYRVQPSNISSYITGAYMVGKPVYSMFSYRWAKLDPKTGDPQGYYNGQLSKSYADLIGSTDTHELVYNGPIRPAHFGNITNTIVWKNLSLSFNLGYKLGYYFRRNSLDYYKLYQGQYQLQPDFAARWKVPGDEGHTEVPSMVYPASQLRDLFYTNSEILVEKGDHIRLQHIRLSYGIGRQHFKVLPFQKAEIYLYANNMGILWRSNKLDIDPDSPALHPNAFFAAGIKIDF